MKRIFMYSNCNFPRGSASANYLQYLGEAFIEIGYDVYLIANGSYDKCQYNKEKHLHEYKKISFVKLKDKCNVLDKFINKLVPVREFKSFVKKRNPGKNDLIIVYSSDINKLKRLLKFAKHYDVKIIACIVEWFPKEFYQGNSYKKYQEIFDKIYPRFNLLFPISHYIADYLESRGAKCFVLPIMADPYEYNVVKLSNFRVKKFLFIKNGRMKDCDNAIFDALNSMSLNEFKNLEFHFKGYKDTEVKGRILPKLWPLLGKHIITHGWMEYDELVNLYSDMTFLILPREKNQMTLANFPSKIPEVMCFGVIPIVSDVGDYTKFYLKNHVDSLYISECNGIECLNAIREATNLSDITIERMSKQAIKTAVERFDYRVWKEPIRNVLNKIETY